MRTKTIVTLLLICSMSLWAVGCADLAMRKVSFEGEKVSLEVEPAPPDTGQEVLAPQSLEVVPNRLHVRGKISSNQLGTDDLLDLADGYTTTVKVSQGGWITLTRPSTLTADLTTTLDIKTSQGVTIAKDLYVIGTGTFGSTVTGTTNVSVTGSITAGGAITAQLGLGSHGGLTVTAGIVTLREVTVTGGLTTTGPISAGDGLASGNGLTITAGAVDFPSGSVPNVDLARPASYFPLALIVSSGGVTPTDIGSREVGRFTYPMATTGISATASTDVSSGANLTVTFWVDGSKQPAEVVVGGAGETTYYATNSDGAFFTPTIAAGSVLTVGFEVTRTDAYSIACVSLLFTTTHAP